MSGLCPSGWLIPSDEDWKVMERELGMSEEDSNAMGRRGTNQGAQVKADYGWGIEGNGTNSSGFQHCQEVFGWEMAQDR